MAGRTSVVREGGVERRYFQHPASAYKRKDHKLRLQK